jgi:putative cell wall-binding protein
LTPSICSTTGLTVNFLAAGRCQVLVASSANSLYDADSTVVSFLLESPPPTTGGGGGGGGGAIGGGGSGGAIGGGGSGGAIGGGGGGGAIGGGGTTPPEDADESDQAPEAGEPVAQTFLPRLQGVVAAEVSLPVGPLVVQLVGAKGLGDVVVTPFSGRPPGTGRGIRLPDGFVDIHAEVDFDVAEICVPFDVTVIGSSIPTVDDLRLFHFTDHAEDITSRVDLDSGQVCGVTTSFSPFGVGTLDTERLAGDNRYDTAVQISRSGFDSGVPIVFVASGEGFADALAAGAAAGLLGGPVLLSPSRSLPDGVRQELERLDPARVVIVGGARALSERVFNQIEQAVPRALVDRLAGADRYDTAALIAHFSHPGGSDTVYLATGRAAPDALAAGAAAVRDGAPILLVPANGSLPDPVVTALAHLAPREVVVLGGRAAVDNGTVAHVERILPGTLTLRHEGENRYDTAARAVAGFTTASHVYVALGTQFPDALAATALAGHQGVPVLLVDPSGVPGSTAEVLRRLAPERIIVLGGTAAISRGIESRLAGYLNE